MRLDLTKKIDSKNGQEFEITHPVLVSSDFYPIKGRVRIKGFGVDRWVCASWSVEGFPRSSFASALYNPPDAPEPPDNFWRRPAAADTDSSPAKNTAKLTPTAHDNQGSSTAAIQTLLRTDECNATGLTTSAPGKGPSSLIDIAKCVAIGKDGKLWKLEIYRQEIDPYVGREAIHGRVAEVSSHLPKPYWRVSAWDSYGRPQNENYPRLENIP